MLINRTVKAQWSLFALFASIGKSRENTVIIYSLIDLDISDIDDF